ncbi:hypothetical protein M0R89_03535 [Halorussus limi]|uniref:Uncharacterized protein n=1 Tax=Halorussus limi TaxID=2938695 RepID=A0A8U0HW54_9EURY|nr:hypothetical protein [Halorussus limi]UPV75147.1 hypothetical protein M0R89_03535 [Halorussus limi]
MTVGTGPVAAGIDPLAVAAGPVSAWSVAAVVGWLVVVVLVWLLFFAYGRGKRQTPRP